MRVWRLGFAIVGLLVAGRQLPVSQAYADDSETCSHASFAMAERMAACTREIESGGCKAPISPPRTSTAASPNAASRDVDRAMADYDEAIELDPKNILVYTSRAGLYLRRGDPGARHRRLQRGDRDRSYGRLCLLQSRQRLLQHARLRPRHQRLQRSRPAGLRPSSSPTTAAAPPMSPKAISMSPSPTTARRFGSIPVPATPTTAVPWRLPPNTTMTTPSRTLPK